MKEKFNSAAAAEAAAAAVVVASPKVPGDSKPSPGLCLCHSLVAARWPDDLRLTRTQGDAAGAGSEGGGGLALSLSPSLPSLKRSPFTFAG